MELWDILDNNRNSTGKTHVRGNSLTKGEYHLVVEVWIVNTAGKILLTKRHPKKKNANLWECTGGSVLAGEISCDAAKREVREEIGINLEKRSGEIIFQYLEDDSFYDVWLFLLDIDLSIVKLQEGEVTDIKFVSTEELSLMFETGQNITQQKYILGLLKKENY